MNYCLDFIKFNKNYHSFKLFLYNNYKSLGMMNASRYPTSSTTTTLPDYDNGSQLENAQGF